VASLKPFKLNEGEDETREVADKDETGRTIVFYSCSVLLLGLSRKGFRLVVTTRGAEERRGWRG